MMTYTKRSNCIRAARKALGSQAQVDVDFRVYKVPMEVDGAETTVERFAWEATEPPTCAECGKVVDDPDCPLCDECGEAEGEEEQTTEAQPETQHRAERHGVIATIADLVRGRTEANAISKEEILGELCERFPARDPEKMRGTVDAMVPTNIRDEYGVNVRKVGRKPTRYFGS